MDRYTTVFERYEEKYVLTGEQHRALEALFSQPEYKRLLCPDAFGGHSHIGNVYFDTPDHRLIRRSLEKPVYKEKLRLRSYRVPGKQDEVFIELKKKFKGIVYKRRVALPLFEAESFLYDRAYPENPAQVEAEILWLLRHYSGIGPSMYISYERRALRGLADEGLRITFDKNIRWRESDLHLDAGLDGQMLLEKKRVIMEVKTPGALPLWLVRIFSELEIRPDSFSKYGHAYTASRRARPDFTAKEILFHAQ